MKKELKIYQYPFTISPKIENSNINIKEILSQTEFLKLEKISGDFFISGDSLYTIKKVNQSLTFKCTFNLKEKREYILEFNKCANEKVLKLEEIQNNASIKVFYEMAIRDILLSNSKLKLYKGTFVNINDKQKIKKDNVLKTFYYGFTII